MKKSILVLFSLLFLFFLQNVGAVWINQVYYDPIISEIKGEAVELFNPSNDTVDLTGWVLWTTTSKTDVVIPEGMYIEPKGYFLIADVGWNESKDNPEWRDADLEHKMTLRNSNGGVALVDKDGGIVDSVGWGNPALIPEELFEGTPAKHVKEGESLLRIQDTDDNSVDFVVSKSPFFFSNFDVFIDVDVGFGASGSSNFFIKEDDSPEEGIQIRPFKGGIRKVGVFSKNPGSFFFMGEKHDFVLVNDSYESFIEISYDFLPGMYTLMGDEENFDFEILPVKGLALGKRNIKLDIIPGSFGSKSIELINIGNVDLKVYARCNKLFSGERELEGDIFVMQKDLDVEWKEIYALAVGESKDAEISISVKDKAEKGSYNSVLSFKGE
jgi:hypothetical protein